MPQYEASQLEQDLNAVLRPDPRRFDGNAGRRLVIARPNRLIEALLQEIKNRGAMRGEALKHLAWLGDDAFVPQLGEALKSDEAQSVRGVVEGVVLACSRGILTERFREAHLAAFTDMATCVRPPARSTDMHAALRQLPQALVWLNTDAARLTMSSDRCIRPDNLVIGHVFTTMTDRYDHRLRGAARGMDPTAVMTVFESLAGGPWIVDAPAVEQYVRLAVLKGVAAVDAATARRVLRKPELFRLGREDLKEYAATEIRAILKSVPSPEDVVYWAEDHPGALPPEMAAVVAAFQLHMETANDGLSHALEVSIASRDALAQGLRVLGFEESAAAVEREPDATAVAALEKSLIKHLETARRRVARHIEQNARFFTGVPGAL